MGWHPYSGAAGYIYANDCPGGSRLRLAVPSTSAVNQNSKHLHDDESDATSTIASTGVRQVHASRVPRAYHFHARGCTEPEYTPRPDLDAGDGLEGSPRCGVIPILRHPFAASVPQVATIPPQNAFQSHRYKQLSVSTDDTRVEIMNSKQAPLNATGRPTPIVRFDTAVDEKEITWRRRREEKNGAAPPWDDQTYNS
ncbi:hypothetical protein D9619_010088 [Psilocybe cf. subviscida]|uniref:Uncharacterized protein n=1 Tax=Psilocybe cf. subviscida TaxID=2480587 RepID=A0A8H5BLG9_9AGAR|nr:hypothetical protein D9619_010088 [Psilocybe cf. subviscida]